MPTRFGHGVLLMGIHASETEQMYHAIGPNNEILPHPSTEKIRTQTCKVKIVLRKQIKSVPKQTLHMYLKSYARQKCNASSSPSATL